VPVAVVTIRATSDPRGGLHGSFFFRTTPGEVALFDTNARMTT